MIEKILIFQLTLAYAIFLGVSNTVYISTWFASHACKGISIETIMALLFSSSVSYLACVFHAWLDIRLFETSFSGQYQRAFSQMYRPGICCKLSNYRSSSVKCWKRFIDVSICLFSAEHGIPSVLSANAMNLSVRGIMDILSLSSLRDIYYIEFYARYVTGNYY